MRQKKIGDYAPYLDALQRQNIEYKPMIWSAFGRPHATTTEALRNICRRAARRRGLARADVLQRRAEASIAVEIWRRAAKMVFHCWPKLEEEEDEAGDPQ